MGVRAGWVVYTSGDRLGIEPQWCGAAMAAGRPGRTPPVNDQPTVVRRPPRMPHSGILLSGSKLSFTACSCPSLPGRAWRGWPALARCGPWRVPAWGVGQATERLRGEVGPVSADRRAERCCDRVEAPLAAAVQRQRAPLVRERLGNAAAEAVGRAGNQNGFRAQLNSVTPLSWRCTGLVARGAAVSLAGPRHEDGPGKRVLEDEEAEGGRGRLRGDAGAVTDGTSSALTAM